MDQLANVYGKHAAATAVVEDKDGACRGNNFNLAVLNDYLCEYP
jgi:hypothetical protein